MELQRSAQSCVFAAAGKACRVFSVVVEALKEQARSTLAKASQALPVFAPACSPFGSLKYPVEMQEVTRRGSRRCMFLSFKNGAFESQPVCIIFYFLCLTVAPVFGFMHNTYSFLPN